MGAVVEEGAAAGALFHGVVALFLEQGVQPRRLQVWKQKLLQRGGVLQQHIKSSVTHIFAIDVKFLEKRIGPGHLKKLRAVVLKYDWLEDCLKAGHPVEPEPYFLIHESMTQTTNSGESHPSLTLSDDDLGSSQPDSVESKHSSEARQREEESNPGEPLHKHRKIDWMSIIREGAKLGVIGSNGITTNQSTVGNPSQMMSPESATTEGHASVNLAVQAQPHQSIQEQPAQIYSPPDLNKNVTSIFGELKNIYGDGLGDDRRSFSYYKANSVLEKLPFKITSVDQVKGLPSIGRSLQDQIGEIISTGTLAKLEHFKEDEKVCARSLFAAVWGIGPATALKLYEKGHRSLEDLEGEKTLTSAQRIGLKFHSDINKKIPRHEVQEMEKLIRNWAESIDQNVIVVCGGSYRRGKALVGDMDIVVTHPDGKSHAGFLRKLVHKLKELDFLSEDLLLGMDHNVEVTERGVDTYFGLCKYPGREQRHRIDLKVFPIEKYPYGLIAWTGNDVLNRRLRILADSKGYKIDDHGCFPATKDANGDKIANRSWSVPCKTEREVFDFVGFPWLEPHERNL